MNRVPFCQMGKEEPDTIASFLTSLLSGSKNLEIVNQHPLEASADQTRLSHWALCLTWPLVPTATLQSRCIFQFSEDDYITWGIKYVLPLSHNFSMTALGFEFTYSTQSLCATPDTALPEPPSPLVFSPSPTAGLRTESQFTLRTGI